MSATSWARISSSMAARYGAITLAPGCDGLRQLAMERIGVLHRDALLGMLAGRFDDDDAIAAKHRQREWPLERHVLEALEEDRRLHAIEDPGARDDAPAGQDVPASATAKPRGHTQDRQRDRDQRERRERARGTRRQEIQ